MCNINVPHAAHVRGEVEDLVASRHDLLAVVVDAEVDEVELVAELLLLYCFGDGTFRYGGRGQGGRNQRPARSEREGETKREAGRAAGGISRPPIFSLLPPPMKPLQHLFRSSSIVRALIDHERHGSRRGSEAQGSAEGGTRAGRACRSLSFALRSLGIVFRPK